MSDAGRSPPSLRPPPTCGVVSTSSAFSCTSIRFARSLFRRDRCLSVFLLFLGGVREEDIYHAPPFLSRLAFTTWAAKRASIHMSIPKTTEGSPPPPCIPAALLEVLRLLLLSSVRCCCRARDCLSACLIALRVKIDCWRAGIGNCCVEKELHCHVDVRVSCR